MTRTEARRVARAQLARGGYFITADGGDLFCPLCRERIHAYWHPWARRGETASALVGALFTHLMEGHSQ